MPVPIVIDNTGTNTTAGRVTDRDFPLSGEVVLVTTANQANITGGVLPMTIDEYALNSAAVVFDFLQSADPITPSGLSVTATIDADGSFFNSSGTVTQKTANVWPLDYDPATRLPLGRPINVASTNLLLNSLADGTNLSTQSVTLPAAAHTLSFYGTGTITLSGASTAGPLVGTGANNRVTLAFTPSAGSVTFTVSGQVRWAQLESTASVNYATPFIPTAGAAVTRSADVVSIALPSVFVQSGGTVVCEWLAGPGAAAISSVVWSLNDGTANERYSNYTTPTQHGLIVTDGGVQQANMVVGAVAAGNIYRTAYSFQANNLNFAANGTLATADTSATLPTVTTLNLGHQVGAAQGNLWLRKWYYFTSVLGANNLQRVSA